MVACPGIRLSGKAALPPFPAQDAAIVAGYEGATGLSRLEKDRQRRGRGRYWVRRSLPLGGANYGIEGLLKKPNRGLVVSQPYNQNGKGGEVWFGRPGCRLTAITIPEMTDY